MQSKKLLFILLLCSSFFTQAQRPYYNERPEFLKANSVWAFGINAGLDFNSGAPIPIKTAMLNYLANSLGMEGYASVADPITGQLLFYSDGGKCWSADHEVMPNGDTLFGNGRTLGIANNSRAGFSTAQGVCIVPVIESPGKYYLFSLMGSSNTPTTYANGTLFYSIVDMNLNNGLGDIVNTQKNIPLNYDTLSEAMIAIPGNCNDIWLLLHAVGKPEFIAYHITENGINTTPIISNTGINSIHGPKSYRVGVLTVAPDRKKIAMTSLGDMYEYISDGILIAEFDPDQGTVKNQINIADSIGRKGIFNFIDYQPYGVCFSPDNSKLYATICDNVSPYETTIYQFDLSVYDSASISSSVTAVGSNLAAGALRLYNDTIYCDAIGLPQYGTGNGTYIRRINQPNVAGIACDYQDSAIVLLPDTRGKYGLGNDVVYPIVNETIYKKDTSICRLDKGFILDAADGYNNYEWNDGSTLNSITISSPGTYWVRCIDECRLTSRVDTFIVSERDFTPPVITVDVRKLGTTIPYSSYQWILNGNTISGATDSVYIVLENGDYQVIVRSKNDCIDTSDVYKVTNVVGMGDVNFSADQIHIFPNPASDIINIITPIEISIELYSMEGKLIKQEKNTVQINIAELSSGLYFLKIYDPQGRFLRFEKVAKQ